MQNPNTQQQQQPQVQQHPPVNVLSSDSIKMIAESIGISNLNEEACRDLINDLNFTVKNLLHDSKKIIRKSKRRNLLVSDIDSSLKLKNFESIYGFTLPDIQPIRATSGVGNASKNHIVP